MTIYKTKKDHQIYTVFFSLYRESTKQTSCAGCTIVAKNTAHAVEQTRLLIKNQCTGQELTSGIFASPISDNTEVELLNHI